VREILSGVRFFPWAISRRALRLTAQSDQKILLPDKNFKDLEDLPPELQRKIEFVPVKHPGEVLKVGFKG